ncbi:MAG: hypothetical protein ACQCN5_05155 [Candidatus Bathyarchaeia archaeon]
MAQSEENGYLFIGQVPLVYSKRNIERQQKIETWLTLYQLTAGLNAAKQQLETAAIPEYIC